MIEVRLTKVQNNRGEIRWRVEDISDDYPRDPVRTYSEDFRSEARALRVQRTRRKALSKHAAKIFWPIT